MTKGWITPTEALKLDPSFFERRRSQEWQLDTQRQGAYSQFGFCEYRIQTDEKGMPKFGRWTSGEAPNINAVAWFEAGGIYYVGVTHQVRPFADDSYGVPADPPLVFAQPIMGFLDKIVGKRAGEIFESAEAGAQREALEEAGVTVIEEIVSMGKHWGNPTGPLVTPSELLDIRVNPEKLIDIGDQAREELIYKCEYISIEELLQRIAAGEHEGVQYRASVAMNTFFVWLTRHPEALPRSL